MPVHHIDLGRPQEEVSRYSWDQYQNDLSFAFNGQRYLLSGGTGGWTKTEDLEHSFTSYINNLYKSNGVIFAIILARMLLFTEGRFCWFEINENGDDGKAAGRRGLELLEKPWPNGGTGELMARMEQDATLGGNFFAAGETNRIRRLRPDWVTIVLTAPPAEATRSDVAGYWYHPGRTYSNAGNEYGKDDEVYLPDEVCHWSPIPDPDAQYRGMSWLSPVVREVMADKAARDHKLAFFENGATFGAIISAKESLTNQQYKEWKANFEGIHSGAANAYKSLFLASPVDTSVLSANMQQLDFKVVQGAGETRLCAAGGVPPIIVGLSEGLASATYSNYGMARRKFGDHWAHPQWKSASQALSTLVDPPGEDLRLGVNTKGIAFLREDAKDLATIQQIKASTLSTLIMGGFTPESAVSAVEAEDLSLLEHTGLTSVQLVPPGTAEGSVEDEEAGEEYDALLDEFADDGMERARYNVRNPEGSVGGGRFRRLSDAIIALLRDSDGDDPLEDFTQPQLKKAAADLGLTEPRKRYTAKQLKLMLAQHARGGKAPAKKAAPARRAFDPAEVAGQVASQKSESEVIGLLASDPTLTSAKLRKVAEYLGIDVPDEVKSKSQLQLLIAEEEASQRDLPFEAPAKKATPRAPAKKAAPRRLTDTEADSLSTAQFSADGSVVTSNARTRANLERDGFVDERGRITDAGRAALAAHQPSTFDAGDTAKELFGLKDDDEGLRGALEGLSKAQLRAVFQVMRHPEPGSRATSGRAGFALPPASQRADAPALREALFAALTRDRRIREDSADRREQQARQRQADIDTAQHYAAVAGELAEYLDAEADPEVVARRLRQEGRKRGIADEVEPIAAAVERGNTGHVARDARARSDWKTGDKLIHSTRGSVTYIDHDERDGQGLGGGAGGAHWVEFDDGSEGMVSGEMLSGYVPDARTLAAALLADHGITQDGAARDSGRFTPSQHTPIGASIREGAPVEVVRPGFTLERDGERIRIAKAVVEEVDEPAASAMVPGGGDPDALTPDELVAIGKLSTAGKFADGGWVRVGDMAPADRASLESLTKKGFIQKHVGPNGETSYRIDARSGDARRPDANGALVGDVLPPQRAPESRLSLTKVNRGAIIEGYRNDDGTFGNVPEDGTADPTRIVRVVVQRQDPVDENGQPVRGVFNQTHRRIIGHDAATGRRIESEPVTGGSYWSWVMNPDTDTSADIEGEFDVVTPREPIGASSDLRTLDPEAARDITSSIDAEALLEVPDDRRTLEILKRQGFDGLPEVVDTAGLDAAVRGGATELYRGTSAEFAEQFRTGDLRVSSVSAFGEGIYAVPPADIGLAAGTYAGPGGLIRMALRPDARTTTRDELHTERQRRSGEWSTAEQLLYMDDGRFAAALGYDALAPGGPESRRGGGWLILNRTALVVQREPGDATLPGRQRSVADLAALRVMEPEAARDALDLRKIEGPDGLKAMLREAGLPVSGRKRELVDRLVGHLHPQGSAVSPSASSFGSRELDVEVVPGHLHPGDSPTEARPPMLRELERRSMADLRRLAKMFGSASNGTDRLTLAHDIRASRLRAWRVPGEPNAESAAVSADEELRRMLQEIDAKKRARAKRSEDPDEATITRSEDEPEDDDHGEPDDEQRARAQACIDACDEDADEPDDGDYEMSRAAGADTNLGGERLHYWWTKGPGLKRWAGSPHPWTTLYTQLLEKVGNVGKAKRMASRWFIEVFGYAAGSDKHRVASGKPPRGDRIGPG